MKIFTIILFLPLVALSQGLNYFYGGQPVYAGQAVSAYAIGIGGGGSGTGITNTLIARWKFNDATGNIAVDSAGNGYNLSGITNSTWGTGGINGSGYIDYQTPDYIQTVSTNIGNLNGTAKTINFWLKREPVANPNEEYLVSKGSYGAGNPGFYISATSSTSHLRYTRGNSQTEGTTPIDDGSWHMVSVVFSTTDCYVFLDATNQQIYKNLAPVNSTNTFRLSNGSFPFGGSIDDMTIFEGALTTNQLQTIQTGGPDATY